MSFPTSMFANSFSESSWPCFHRSLADFPLPSSSKGPSAPKTSGYLAIDSVSQAFMAKFGLLPPKEAKESSLRPAMASLVNR